jgi:hypothetical protein
MPSAAAEVLALMQRGAENRRVAATQLNDQSSRSHSIFTATVQVRLAQLVTGTVNHTGWRGEAWWSAVGNMLQVDTTTNRGVVARRTSRLTLVDLAGTALLVWAAQLDEAPQSTGHPLLDHHKAYHCGADCQRVGHVSH